MKKKTLYAVGFCMWLAAVWLQIDGMLEKRESNLFFDAPAEVILTEHRGEHGGGSSVLEIASDQKMEYKTMMEALCGNTEVLTLQAEENGRLDFQGHIRKGEARAMLEQQETDEIIEFYLEDGMEEQFALEKGEYILFLTGRDFKGSISFTGQNIVILQEE